MKPKLRRWVIGISIGMLIGAVVTLLLYPLVIYPYVLSPDAKLARRNGYNVLDYVTVKRLTTKSRDEKHLSAGDLESLRTLVNNKDSNIRMYALSALFGLKNSNQSTQAADIARTKLTDSDAIVRQYALGALYRLHTPDALSVARGLLNDPDENVRIRARKVINSYASQHTD